MCGHVPRGVREQPLARVVEAADVGEALLSEEMLEPARRVAELGRPVLVRGFAALEPVLPVRLRQEQLPAGPERAARGRKDEVGARGVVERVVEQARVEAPAEVELLHVGGFEADIEAFLLGEVTRDSDHLGRDVVALGLDAVVGGEPRHPAGAAAELAEAHPGAKVEQLQDVAEVDQQPRRLARRVPERLRPDPGAPFLADRARVVDLRLLTRVSGHGRILRAYAPTTTATCAPIRSRGLRPSSGETTPIPRSRPSRNASGRRPIRYMIRVRPKPLRGALPTWPIT